jgi:imidazolonepropionase-like amidohydrolase
MNNRLSLSVGSLLLASLTLPGPAVGQVIAITGATIYPVSGPKVEQGTILIREGHIAAVGTEVAVPSDAIRIEATGKVVTPGLIHGGTDIGLNLFESGGQLETREGTESGDVNAAFNVAAGIDPHSLTIAPTRIEGVTTVLSAPSGGLIAGQAVIIDLLGERMEDMLVKSPAAMVVDLSEGGKPAGGGSRAGMMQRIRQILTDAQEYAQRKADYRRAQMQPLSAPAADLEALSPVLQGTIPLYAIANRKADIENAVRLARDFHLRLIIWGGVEAWQTAPQLAAAKVPVAVSPLTDIPSFDALGARLDNAALLRKAGVTVMIVQRGEGPNDRLVRFAAGNAVSYGMAWDDALAAVTLVPAQVLGIADRYGSLEPGKVANLVIWSGDPFEFATDPVKVFIRGVEVPAESRQTELLERYRTLPPKY